jgi:hypothetical protein
VRKEDEFWDLRAAFGDLATCAIAPLQERPVFVAHPTCKSIVNVGVTDQRAKSIIPNTLEGTEAHKHTETMTELLHNSPKKTHK